MSLENGGYKNENYVNGVEANKESINVSPDTVKNWNIEFGYEKFGNNENIVTHLNNRYEGDKSLTGILAHNEQIQGLLGDILSNYSNYIKQDEGVLKKIIEKKKNREGKDQTNEQGEIIEYFEEYLLNNNSQEGFEEFLLSNGCIGNILLPYLQNRVNNNGELNANLISKNNIKAKIKAERYKKLYIDYNKKYDLEVSDKLLKVVKFGESIKDSIDGIISKYLSEGTGDKDKEFFESLEGLVNNPYVKEIIKSNQNGEMSESNQNAREKFNFLLRNSIKEYSRLLDIGNENRTLKKTGDNVFDTQLRAYLFLYGKIYYPDIFTSNGGTLDKYEGDLGKILEAILITDGKLDINKDSKEENNYIQNEENIQKRLRTRETSSRETAKRRRIRKPQIDREKPNDQPSDNIENKNLDIQNASGVEIAHEMNLGKDLGGFSLNESKPETDIFFKRRLVFEKTCEDFSTINRQKIKEFDIKISNFFYYNNDGFGVKFNNAVWRKWEEENRMNKSKINELKKILNQFVRKYNDNLDEIDQNESSKKEDVDSVVKEYAIGAVIDSIKDMFQNIIRTSNEGSFQSGFEFNGNNTARIENNNLIISGKFNGENLTLKYDLINGTLFMNAYISNNVENNGEPSMTIGDNTPKHRIGKLNSFQSILDDFYKSPTDFMSDDVLPKIRKPSKPHSQIGEKSDDKPSRPRRSPRKGIIERKRMMKENIQKFREFCGTNKIDEINGNIKNHVESKTIQDTAVSNLLKTLNIMPENSDNNKIVTLKGGSDLFNAIQVITDSKKEDIINFSDFLGKLMPRIGLKWGNNNLLGLDKTTNESKLVFDEKNGGNTMVYIRGKIGNFNEELNKNNGSQVFDSGQHFGILSMINEKFIEGDKDDPSKRKLSKSKIENFYKEFSEEFDSYREKIDKQKDVENQQNVVNYTKELKANNNSKEKGLSQLEENLLNREEWDNVA